MGFSLPELLVVVAVLAPNLWLCPPRTPVPDVSMPAVLTWLERIGQALCVVVPIVTVGRELRWWWLVLTVVALLAYYAPWGRYLRFERNAA